MQVRMCQKQYYTIYLTILYRGKWKYDMQEVTARMFYM